jgi:hypothetical protein
MPSFWTKRWVLSETLEKYTRLEDGTVILSLVLLRRLPVTRSVRPR